MKSVLRKSERQHLLVALATTFLLGVAGCDETAAIKQWVAKVEPLRVKAVGEISSVPYQAAQHQVFKNYFAEIGGTALRLVQDNDFATAFNKAIAKTDLKDACVRVFMERRDWEAIRDHCLRNGLFICAEEVRVYPDLVASIRSRLVPEQQRRFDAVPECERAL